MGLSETILAAMIGALATVTTALFQLFNSFKQQRNRVDVRPKRGSTMRSILAVLALMIASAAGGFLYSEFIKQRSAEDMRAMRTELKELRSLIADQREPARAEVVATAHSEASVQPAETSRASMQNVADSVESVVDVPACSANSSVIECAEQDAQRITPCVPEEPAPMTSPLPPASAPAQVPAVIAAESLPALPATTAAFTGPAEPR